MIERCSVVGQKSYRRKTGINRHYTLVTQGKKAVGDSIYEGIPEKVTGVRNGQSAAVKEFLNRALARHENYNGRCDV